MGNATRRFHLLLPRQPSKLLGTRSKERERDTHTHTEKSSLFGWVVSHVLLKIMLFGFSFPQIKI